jgi:hypothetical protein
VDKEAEETREQLQGATPYHCHRQRSGKTLIFLQNSSSTVGSSRILIVSSKVRIQPSLAQVENFIKGFFFLFWLFLGVCFAELVTHVINWPN